MTEDRTLEEFARNGEASAGTGEGDGGAVDDDDAKAVDDDANAIDGDAEGTDLQVEPARGTHDWSPDGATCAACGESVERRWRAGEESVAADAVPDPDAMVCDDCKVW